MKKFGLWTGDLNSQIEVELGRKEKAEGMQNERGGKNEKVDLRQRTKDFALRVIRMFTSLPKNAVAATLGRQVLRSGTAVGANYREAFRARSKAEFMSKCGDSLRELEESAYWLELLVDAGIVALEQLSHLLQECDELIAIFVAIRKHTKQK